jgi:hypothetical protein
VWFNFIFAASRSAWRSAFEGGMPRMKLTISRSGASHSGWGCSTASDAYAASDAAGQTFAPSYSVTASVMVVGIARSA